jgi:ribonuclease HI
MITMYTDGGCSGNPGPGGYGTLLLAGKHRKVISGGFRKTTNNRMELLAVIIGLETLKNPNSSITIYTDSKYVCDSVTKGWLNSWVKKGFKGKKNVDLWKRYLKIAKLHNVCFQWVKGHAGNEHNEFVDGLAVAAYKKGNLDVDIGFETEEKKLL